MTSSRSFRSSDELRKCTVNEENLSTVSSIEQKKVEKVVGKLFHEFNRRDELEIDLLELYKDRHITFLTKGLISLPENYECLDCSRPWLCYWILHSLELLNVGISETLSNQVANFLSLCQDVNGGFAGGPGQIPHIAPTYAAINALCILGNETAYDVINRIKLKEFLWRMKVQNGGFRMHDDGEVDVRGIYCALSASRLTAVYEPELFDNCVQWIINCQTYEGGFSGVPGMEAHGGYAFCALAALTLLGKAHLCDIKALLKWAANRQMRFEGGFQGRTNKLVDGCYSFWQGGIFPLILSAISSNEPGTIKENKWLFDQRALQEYILICCQFSSGGLIDKPGKMRDYYHTCYVLSGLSVAQHFVGGNKAADLIMGTPENELALTHPVYNIGLDAVVKCTEYFKARPV